MKPETTLLRVELGLVRRLKVLAARRGVSIKELVDVPLRKLLRKGNGHGRTL
jgi:hypothetical protein